MSGSKACTRCGFGKSFDDFYPKPEAKDGRRSVCKACDNKITKSAYANRRQEINSQRREARLRDRLVVIDHYSDYSRSCRCCGNSYLPHLSIDHINGRGAEHRKQIGHKLVSWLIANDFPPGFQILCNNCNMAKHWLGRCGCQDNR